MSASDQAVELVLMRRLKECGGGATLDMLTRDLLVSETLSPRELVRRGLEAGPDAVEEAEPQLVFSVSVFSQWIGRMLDGMSDSMTMDDAAQALDALVVQKPQAAPWPGVFPPWWTAAAKRDLTTRMLRFTLEPGPDAPMGLIVSWDGERYDD